MPIGRPFSRPLSRDSVSDYRDDTPISDGKNIFVWGLERYVDPSELTTRRLKTAEELAEPPKADGWAQYVLSIDVGMKHDRTALSVVENRYKGDRGFYTLQAIRRLRQGILFKDIATQVASAEKALKADAKKKNLHFDSTILVDATGLGLGAYNQICEKAPNSDVRAVYITSGTNPRTEDDEIYLPKRVMIAALIQLLENGRLILSKQLKELDALIEELYSYEMHVSETGVETYSAKTNRFDDMIASLAMNVWFSEALWRPLEMWSR